ncbi:MAG: Tat pathway signal protein, partial [Acidobacteria bacterium]|nr:Tat pathway signal protein [Acidobacteriota bacterium]
FLDMRAATRFKQVELSAIDTVWLLAGALYAREYFDGDQPDERRIRDLADALLDRVDWRWMASGGDTLTMGWHPESGFIKSRWVGYNEAMFLYILALGARHEALGPEAWEAWTRGYRWQTHYGQSYVEFAPLFGYQYSHCWVDFRGIADAFLRGRGLDYFENSRRATLANRAYCIANPKSWHGYGPDCWGLTACDGPGFAPYHGYWARAATPSVDDDDGTVAPAAAGGSLPFAPQECLAALRYLYHKHRERLWTPYGFRDAFNETAGWWDPDVLGIDQGPILIMVENHRTGRVWRRMMRNDVIRRGLQRAGFVSLASDAMSQSGAGNPAFPETTSALNSRLAPSVSSSGEAVPQTAGSERARLHGGGNSLPRDR